MLNRIRGKHILWGVLQATVLGLAAVVAVPIEAAEEKPGEDEIVQTLSNLDLADGLINYGRSTKTPEALVTAALILHRNPTEDIKVEGAEKPDTSLTPKALLEEARGMRKDDKALAGLIDNALDTIKEAPRGIPTHVVQSKSKVSHGKPLKTKHQIHTKKPKGMKHGKGKVKATRHPNPNEDAKAKAKKHRTQLHLIVTDPKGKVVADKKSAPGADSVEADVPAPAPSDGGAPPDYHIEVHAVPVDAPAAAAEAGDPAPPSDVSVHSWEEPAAAAPRP